MRRRKPGEARLAGGPRDIAGKGVNRKALLISPWSLWFSLHHVTLGIASHFLSISPRILLSRGPLNEFLHWPRAKYSGLRVSPNPLPAIPSMKSCRETCGIRVCFHKQPGADSTDGSAMRSSAWGQLGINKQQWPQPSLPAPDCRENLEGFHGAPWRREPGAHDKANAEADGNELFGR